MSLRYPFHLIANNCLGVSYSSFNQVGEILPGKSFGQAKIKIFTNISNGNLVIYGHEHSLIECNFSVELYYLYNSQDGTNGNWRFPNKRFLKLPAKPIKQPLDN